MIRAKGRIVSSEWNLLSLLSVLRTAAITLASPWTILALGGRANKNDSQSPGSETKPSKSKSAIPSSLGHLTTAHE